MTTAARTHVITGIATRQGTGENNADAASVFSTEAGDVGAAVIDLIGHQTAAPFVARLLAETAARIAAQRGGPAGLLSAGLLVADPGAADEPEPDGVAVVAVTGAGQETVISWCGDSHAYGWDGERLHRYTTPHTYGQQLRQYGVPWEISEDHNDWILTTLSRATHATVCTVATEDALVILASDGLDCVPHDELVALVREHAADPQALADALVAATRADEGGYRDDATVVVLGGTGQAGR